MESENSPGDFVLLSALEEIWEREFGDQHWDLQGSQQQQASQDHTFNQQQSQISDEPTISLAEQFSPQTPSPLDDEPLEPSITPDFFTPQFPDSRPKRRSRRDSAVHLCPVCHRQASGQCFYGARVCESCRGFFRRSVRAEKKFYCSKNADGDTRWVGELFSAMNFLDLYSWFFLEMRPRVY